jgi:hypothetical protein
MPDVKLSAMITFLSAVRLGHGFAARRWQSHSQPVERTAAPAARIDVARRFESPSCARPSVSAAVAHLSRSGKLNREWTPMDANNSVASFRRDPGVSIHDRTLADWLRPEVISSRSFASIRGWPSWGSRDDGIPEPDGRANAGERGHVPLAWDHPWRAPRHRSPLRWTKPVYVSNRWRYIL